MIYENELLKMKILIYFHQNEASVCTVGKIAERLGTFKQKISKMIIFLEEEGLVDRSNNRHPQLTKKGTILADKYTTKMKMTTEVLLYAGVNLENVEQDAYNIVMGVSQSTMDSIKRKYMQIQLKKELRGKGKFKGNVIGQLLYDGMYPMEFAIYRKEPTYEEYISMANNGFEHPAYVFVEKGIGKIKMRIKELNNRIPSDYELIRGHAIEMHYYCDGIYKKAEVLGRFVTIPLDDINFTSVGNDRHVQIEGNIFIKIKTSVSAMYMPESEAILSVKF